MSEFRSEPYQNLLAAHTRLNNYIKVSTAAVTHLFSLNITSDELSALVSELIISSGERWTARSFADPKKELEIIKNDLAMSAVIWAYSAFDVYFKAVEGILSEHFPRKEKEDDEKNCPCKQNEVDNNREHKVIEVYEKLGWPHKDIAELLTVLKFYEALRHVVAHNFGKPNKKLTDLGASAAFRRAIANWKTKWPKREIDSPPLVEDEVITIRPHHALMYSETCLRIARDIDERILTLKKISYYIEKTMQKHLLDVAYLTHPTCNSLRNYIAFHLEQDYGIVERSRDQLFSEYSDDQLYDLKVKYATNKARKKPK